MTPNNVTAEERYGFFEMFDQYATKESSAVTYSKKPVEKAPPISLHSPSPPTVGQKSQGKTGSSATDQDNGSAETKLEENKFPIPKSHIPDSQISSLSKTQRGGTSNVKDTSVKTEDPGSPVNKDEGKKEETSKKNEQLTNGSPSAQAEPPPHAKSPPLSPSADAKDQDSAPQSSTTSGTLASTHSNKSVLSTAPTDSSLPQPQVPVLTVSPVVTTANETGTSAFSSASAITTTSTTTTAAPTTVTLSTVSTTQHPISSLNQASGINGSKEPPPLQVAREPKATTPNKEPQQTVEPTPTPVSGSDTGELLDPTQPATDDVNKQTSLSREASSEHKDTRPKPGTQSSNIISQTSGEKPDNFVVATDVKQTRTIYKIDPMHITSSVQIGTNGVNDQLTPHVSGYPGKIPDVKSGKDPINNPITQKGKNNNPNAISEGIPPLTHIIPTLLVILATLTLLFQLYKYTPFGFLLGRRRKRKKQDLKRIFEIPEKPAYEYPNITVHEWEDPNLVGKAVENDVYTKLLKINRYKQEMQKRKKENKKTLIEVHMEVLEEYKSDEWELHKGDFLEICLRGFINEENDNYSKLPNIELTAKSTKNDKIIENIQKHEILWNNWIENHRNILEQWKKEDWFQNLKNEWKNEEHMYKEKNDKLQENILNEEEKHSIVSQKDIWRKWISKQANLIDIFNKEDWFKSMVYAQDKEKDNYHINEYNNVTVTTETQLKNEKPNHEYSRSKGIIQKFMVQIHMMVLEECIKEEIIKQKELCIDNFIEDIHTQNNYDEKRNVPQCNTDNFNVLKYDEIHTSKNK
ncbi:STP1 protein [Plasmodium ovale wallikeri]|uniref:STP1 protein n=2 Tax=Plasmodium ovale TaxID=36330 RepID=A0A1A9AQZ9_PLAOA|nr:STP1 protein [Plasmodium ovale wallikeri]